MPFATHDTCLHRHAISPEVVEHITKVKDEPAWMKQWRMNAFEHFLSLPMPDNVVDLSELDLDHLCFYCKPTEHISGSWNNANKEEQYTFDQFGVPPVKSHVLAGMGAQIESEMLYHTIKKNLVDSGVIFCSMDEAVKLHPEIVRNFIGTIVPINDNKFAALNSALWSGGSLIYVPQNTTVELPIQAYFRMQRERMGQFERTLIIADAHSKIHYIEGCSAMQYANQSLHAAVVEIIVHEHAQVRYTTIQNWSTNVYNLVTKRAYVHSYGHIEWIDGNFGSKVTMKYPCMILAGKASKGSLISLSIAGSGQHQHTGGKVIHQGSETSSNLIAKSISNQNGITTYKGNVKIEQQAHYAKSHIHCHSLIMDHKSSAHAYPQLCIASSTADVGHEASVSSLDASQLNYLLSRGLSMQSARLLIVHGFVNSFIDELPLEYGIELYKLITLDIDQAKPEKPI